VERMQDRTSGDLVEKMTAKRINPVLSPVPASTIATGLPMVKKYLIKVKVGGQP
jgi:hypothetical protein